MFKGFPDQETFTRIPDAFFQQLLKEISELDEMKATLAALWYVEHTEGSAHSLSAADLEALVPEAGPGLEKAVRRGTLLCVEHDGDALYFLNTARGRAAAEACRQGKWAPGKDAAQVPAERRNIFKMYEENIGPLTPLIADALKDAEETYPPEQVAEALEIAVKNNKRSWKYAEAILRRWKEDGHAKEQDRRNPKEVRGRDVTRKVEDFLNK